MQTDTIENVVSSSASPSITLDLHPLVLVNMSDHITKLRVQTKNPNPQGTQSYDHSRGCLGNRVFDHWDSSFVD